MADTLVDAALKGLIGSGPLALVLVVALIVLWKKLERTEAQFFEFLRDAAKGDRDGDGKPG